MIEKIYAKTVRDSYNGNVQNTIPIDIDATVAEILDTLNEVIDTLNRLERQGKVETPEFVKAKDLLTSCGFKVEKE